jgi:hypothetical protein
MVDFIASQVQAKGGAPLASCVGGGGQTKVAATKPANMPPSPSTDGVYGLYRQLAEIHAICWGLIIGGY